MRSSTAGSVLRRAVAALQSAGVPDCLAAYAVHALVFLLPVYALRVWMMAKGMSPIKPPPFMTYEGGWCDWRPLNPLLFYDAIHYMFIAENGYDTVYRTAWFPLYPVLIRLCGGTAASAVFISGVSFFLALMAARRLGGRPSMWALALWPVGLLSASAYSESLFLALTGWALVFMREQRTLRVAVLLGLACLCRPVGWALLAGVGLELARRRGWKPALGACVPAVLIGLLYPLCLWAKFGDPLAFTAFNFEYQKRYFGVPLLGLGYDLVQFLNPPGDFPWEEWRLPILVNLSGLLYLSAALAAWPLLSLPYVLLVLSTGVHGRHMPYIHGFLRYGAGFFPWCLAVRDGIAGRVATLMGALLGIVVSVCLFLKEFVL